MENKKQNSIIIWTLLTLSVVGFVDAVYLTMKRLVGSPITCFAFSGCDTVAQSKFSVLLGIPLSLLGALFYAATIVLLTYYLQKRTKRGLQQVVWIAVFGGLFSIYLFILQAFVIKAWCFYCVISDTIGIASAVMAIYLIRKER